MVDVAEKIKNDSAQGGSSAGYSFYKTYQTCPRRWALENIFGIQTPGVKWALAQGSILHGALELMYLDPDREKLKEYIIGMSQQVDDLSEEDKEQMFKRVYGMVNIWCNNYLEHDLKNFIDIKHEFKIDIPLLGGMSMTGRVDKLYTDKRTGALIIGDYKSTGQGIKAAVKQAQQGDQFTLYTHAIKKLFPDRRVMTVVDVIWGRELKAGWKVDVAREPPFVYTQEMLDHTVTGFTGIVVEVAQKVQSYLNGDLPVEFLFPRNGTVCGIFGCPFAEVCRRKITAGMLTLGDFTFAPEKVKDLQFLRDIEIKVIDRSEDPGNGK